MSSRDESVVGVCKAKFEYCFKDDPVRDDNSSWPFGQVTEMDEVEDEEDDVKEEIGDDKRTVFVLKTGDNKL